MRKLIFWLTVTMLSMIIDCMLINELLGGGQNDSRGGE